MNWFPSLEDLAEKVRNVLSIDVMEKLTVQTRRRNKLSIISYSDALSAVEEAAGKGIGVYEMAVAFELEYAIDAKKKAFRRRKKFIEKLDADAPRLFDVAVETFRKSAGSCTPLDAATGILNSYLNCGMDVARARTHASLSLFAIES